MGAMRSQTHHHLWKGWSSRRTASAIALRWEQGSAHSGDREELKVAAAEPNSGEGEKTRLKSGSLW